ncbi:MAG: hypothetical protein ABL962_21390 [Fimbriimonadaceae bacterium]
MSNFAKQVSLPFIHFGMGRKLAACKLGEFGRRGRGDHAWVGCPQPILGFIVVGDFHALRCDKTLAATRVKSNLGLLVRDEWITKSGEEGVFLCRQK